MRWEDACEALYAVRRQVFVDEQGIAPALEQDGRDADADHVLVCAADGAPIATGRMLADGHIGRVAVLAERRGEGLGRAVMTRLIELARGRGLGRVYLNAQRPALRFYDRLGFSRVGEPFTEAGIVHRTMALNVADWKPAAADATELSGGAASLDAALALIAAARRRLTVYTPALAVALYGAPALAVALRRAAVEQPRFQARLLLPPASQWRRDCAPLAALPARLGAFELRVWPPHEPRDRPEYGLGFWIADDAGALLCHDDPRRLYGRYRPRGGARARALLSFFDGVWAHAQPDRELRRLGV